MKSIRIAILPIMLMVMLIGCSCASGPIPDELILDACSLVCSGQVMSQAADYASGPAPHPVVLLSSSGNKHSWTGKISESWWPATVSDVELVVCVSAEAEEVLQTCRYYGSNIERCQYSLHAQLREATTGEVIEGTTLYGSFPRQCRQWEEEGTTKIRGSHISFDQLEEWLERYVATSTPLTPTPTISWPLYLELGQDLETSDRLVTVTSAIKTHSYEWGSRGSIKSASAGYVFIIIDAKIKNVGRDYFSTGASNFTLNDSDGRRYTEEFYYEEERFAVGLYPGENTWGNVLFEIPEAASGLEIAYKPRWGEPTLAIWQLEW